MKKSLNNMDDFVPKVKELINSKGVEIDIVSLMENYGIIMKSWLVDIFGEKPKPIFPNMWDDLN